MALERVCTRCQGETFSHSRNGTPISLGRQIRSLETLLTELPGPRDREQVTFVGWSWPVARSTRSLFCLTNVATSHRLHKHTVVKFHLRLFSFFLALSFFLHSIAIRFFFCYTSFYLYDLHSFPVFCYSFVPYAYEILQAIARLAALQNGYKYFGVISETDYPLTTQILRHK